MITQLFTLLADSLLERAKALKHTGSRLVQMAAAPRNGGGIDLVYSFDSGSSLVHFRVPLASDEDEVQSITDFFPAAFLSENEIAELWGIRFKGLSIDYKGKLYDPKSPAPFRISPGYPAVPGPAGASPAAGSPSPDAPAGSSAGTEKEKNNG